jgi:hypothetical protein
VAGDERPDQNDPADAAVDASRHFVRFFKHRENLVEGSAELAVVAHVDGETSVFVGPGAGVTIGKRMLAIFR